MESVKDILMRRDGMLPEDADDLIADFQEELDMLLVSGAEGLAGATDAEELVKDFFGLEPDYLWEFI